MAYLCKQRRPISRSDSYSQGRGREAVRFTLPPPPPEPPPPPSHVWKGLVTAVAKALRSHPAWLRAQPPRQPRYALNPFYRHGGMENAGNFTELPYRMSTAFPTPLPLWACRPRPQRTPIIFFLFRRSSLRTERRQVSPLRSETASLRYAPSGDCARMLR